MNKIKTISVIGLGYIGLPTAAIFASRKFNVIGVDVNVETVNTINRGEIHIVEPDLDMVVHAAVKEGFLRAVIEIEPADAFLIAVPTPFKGNNEPDLSYIEAATQSIAKVLKKGDLVILESTSPVGATEKVAQWLANQCPTLTFPQQNGQDSDVRVAHCPERVLPGHILKELIQNDRVIGGMTPKCSTEATELYKNFVKGECFVTDARTAEMCKLTENSFRDVNIAYANELSIICEKLGINVWELIELANRHPRVSILKPGPGVGGHCIAVDPWFVVSAAPDESKLIRTARNVNDSKPTWVISKAIDSMEKLIKLASTATTGKPTVACFGITFKADVDDIRESPSLFIASELARLYPNQVLVVDPYISKLPQCLLSNSRLTSSKDAIENAQLIIFLVNHKTFAAIDLVESDTRIIIDCIGWTDRKRAKPTH